jgi:hypothetical protein
MPISRPRTQQQERSPDTADNRIGNTMVMMMMNQAFDRDKNVQEERRDGRNSISKLR